MVRGIMQFKHGPSTKGWICGFVLLLAVLILLSTAQLSAWWTVRVWDENSTKSCDEFISIILNDGVCSEDSMGKNDDSHCTGFNDSSDWKAIDDYLNTAPNTESADMEGATDTYVNAKRMITASIFFTVCTAVICLLAIFLSTKSYNSNTDTAGCWAKLSHRDNFQLVAGCFGFLGALMSIAAFVSASSSDMTNGEYWQIILCPDTGEKNGTYADSYFSVPDGGYGCAVAAWVFGFSAFSVVVLPGKCCFVSCLGCCECTRDQEEEEFLRSQEDTNNNNASTINNYIDTGGANGGSTAGMNGAILSFGSVQQQNLPPPPPPPSSAPLQAVAMVEVVTATPMTANNIIYYESGGNSSSKI